MVVVIFRVKILISLRGIMLKDTCKRKCLHNEVMNKIDVP